VNFTQCLQAVPVALYLFESYLNFPLRGEGCIKIKEGEVLGCKYGGIAMCDESLQKRNLRE
jgi:hypothetical protein